MYEIRPLVSADLSTVLDLNNEVVPAVDPHDMASIEALIAMADRSWVAEDGAGLGGLLVIFAPGSSYESRNYAWLSERYGNFTYVDRIIVAASHRRLGIAGGLYTTAAIHAAEQGRDRLLCEVNVEPPNPQSIAFHESNGWQAIQDFSHGPGKVVRFFERIL